MRSLRKFERTSVSGRTNPYFKYLHGSTAQNKIQSKIKKKKLTFDPLVLPFLEFVNKKKKLWYYYYYKLKSIKKKTDNSKKKF